MKTIDDLVNEIDRIISVATNQVSTLKEVKALLCSEALKGMSIPRNNFEIFNGKTPTSIEKFNSELYEGYPLNGKFPEKMEFLDKIHPQAWRLAERRELIILIEGEEKAKETLAGETGKVQNLRKSRKWIGAKYGGVNKYTFYVKPEWLSADKKSILDQHCPAMEILNNLPEDKRKSENIVWLQ